VSGSYNSFLNLPPHIQLFAILGYSAAGDVVTFFLEHFGKLVVRKGFFYFPLK